MANEQNLTQMGKPLSTEVAQAMQRKAAEKRKQNNVQRKAVMAILEERLQSRGYKDLDAAIDGLIDRAKDSDKAFELMLAVLGEKPKEQIELSQEAPFEVNISVVE